MPVWLDADEYSALSARDETRVQAIGLYRGELLEGLDDEWITPPRQRFRDQQLSILLALIDDANRRREFHKSLEYAQRILRDDPFHEDAAREVMSSKLALGDRPGALRTYREFTDRLRNEMGVEPMPATAKLYEAIMSSSDESPTATAAGAMTISESTPRNDNLPTAVSSLIGRELEIESLRRTLLERRLVTLTGAAGIGKSRLAMEAARAAAHDVSGGAWLIELAPINDGSLIAGRILAAVGIPPRVGEPAMDVLLPALQARKLLIVLDNCEHLLVEVASLVQRLLSQCSQVKILATSREPLRLPGEFVEHVRPLASPELSSAAAPTLAALREASATCVFLERASDVNTFIRAGNLSDEDRRAIRMICARLDGLPLAIELAAGRMNVLTPRALAQHLDDRFGILTGGDRRAEPRHQTLRAMLDWSYEMLELVQRRIFENLGVFAGSFSLDAAAAVCAGDLPPGLSLLNAISSLTEKCLIFPINEGNSLRYCMLQTMRAYALERLGSEGRLDDVQRRHAEFWIAAATVANGTDFMPDVVSVIDAMLPEIDNVREALAWSFSSRGAPDLAIALVHAARALVTRASATDEIIRWIGGALTILVPGSSAEVEADLRFNEAAAHYTASGDSSSLLDAWTKVLRLYQTLPDQRKASFLLSRMSEFWWLSGRKDAARACAAEALAAAQQTRDDLAIGFALLAQGASLEDIAERKAALDKSLELFRSTGRSASVAHVHCMIAEYEFEDRNAEAALMHAYRAMDMWRERPDVQPFEAQMNIPMYLNYLGRHREALDVALITVPKVRARAHEPHFVYLLQHGATALAGLEHFRSAALLLGYCDARRAGHHSERHVNESREYNELLKQLRSKLEHASLTELRRQGSRLSEEEALAELAEAVPRVEIDALELDGILMAAAGSSPGLQDATSPARL